MPDSSDIYNLTYGHCTHRVLAEIRRETFGEDIGQNSWSTADEYRQFIEWLQWVRFISLHRPLLDAQGWKEAV